MESRCVPVLNRRTLLFHFLTDLVLTTLTCATAQIASFPRWPQSSHALAHDLHERTAPSNITSRDARKAREHPHEPHGHHFSHHRRHAGTRMSRAAFHAMLRNYRDALLSPPRHRACVRPRASYFYTFLPDSADADPRGGGERIRDAGAPAVDDLAILRGG